MHYSIPILFKKIGNHFLKIICFNWIFCFTVCLIFFSSCSSSQKKKEASGALNQALATHVEDLNNVLPQSLDLNTSFDSAGLGSNQLHYYYSISGLTQELYQERQLRDSLYAEAVDRIPCTLWRPVYMQGVEVIFTYYSSEGEELLQFARGQEACGQ